MATLPSEKKICLYFYGDKDTANQYAPRLPIIFDEALKEYLQSQNYEPKIRYFTDDNIPLAQDEMLLVLRYTNKKRGRHTSDDEMFNAFLDSKYDIYI